MVFPEKKARLISSLLLLVFTACSPQQAIESGDPDMRISPCPDRPNCVSSVDTNEDRFIEPLKFSGSVEEAMERLRDKLESSPRVEITVAEGGYIKSVWSSRIFGFKDDVEFLADETSGIIHMRSASRTGYYDFGVNRDRLETIRKEFEQ
jgi:uncharacterized protein (DUF1499 family)